MVDGERFITRRDRADRHSCPPQVMELLALEQAQVAGID
jgi:hypothetical protein